ncbi:hypothetical protein P0Y35_17325 [Kiritimatiellaeota bacterium B1221]|nr:hypothetical protein [Kiritimatiellaeota bacterium B1221]
MGRHQIGLITICMGLFFHCDAVWADENGKEASRGEGGGDSENMVDKAHGSISDYIIESVDGFDQNLDRLLTPEEMERSRTFDRFFGDRSLEETDSRAQIRLGVGAEWSEIDGFDLDLKFSGKVDLPRTENRLKFVFDNLNEDDDTLAAFKKRESLSPALQENDPGGSASIQASLGEIFNIKFTADAGLDFNPEPVPKFKFTGRVPWMWGETEYAFSQRVFWSSDDGFGEKTSLDIKRFFGENFFMKSSTAGIWSERSEGVDLGQTFFFRYLLRKQTTMGIILGAQGHTEPEANMDLYLIRFPFRKPIYHNWIFLVIEPGVDYPEDHGWQFSPLIQVKTEFYFGRL